MQNYRGRYLSKENKNNQKTNPIRRGKITILTKVNIFSLFKNEAEIDQ